MLALDRSQRREEEAGRLVPGNRKPYCARRLAVEGLERLPGALVLEISVEAFRDVDVDVCCVDTVGSHQGQEGRPDAECWKTREERSWRS